MKALIKGVAIIFLVMLVSCCAVVGCVSIYMRKKAELKKQQEEIIAGYPELIKAYLEEKYDCEFCVASKRESGMGSPVPFAQPDYITYTYKAWEDKKDGYAFWTRVYPVSLEDKSVMEIKDNYCWVFINRKIKDYFNEKLEEIGVSGYKIFTFSDDEVLFGRNVNENSTIKQAITNSNRSLFPTIFVVFPPTILSDEDALHIEMETITRNFYDKYAHKNLLGVDVNISETYTYEDFLKIEPDKTEQYQFRAKKSEYADEALIPVKLNPQISISVSEKE